MEAKKRKKRSIISRKAMRLIYEDKIRMIKRVRNESLIFEVKGDTALHTVIRNKKGWSCDCIYFALKQRICSHITSCKIYYQKLTSDEIES